MSESHGKALHTDDWCARLEQAVTDGRFLEDPAHWRAHVNQCETCRQTVEGVFLLRDFVGQARLADDLGDLPPLVGEDVVAEAISRHRAERQRLLTFWSMGVSVVLLVGGLFLFTRSPSAPTEAAGRETSRDAGDPAAAYALALERRLFPPGEAPRYDLLKEDPALRDEYLGALDHPSSYVRRVALWSLTSSGVPLDAARFEQFFLTFDETLDGGVNLAASDDPKRRIEEALAVRRTQTLVDALESAQMQAAHGGLRVRSEVLTPFLVHVHANVRRAALEALRQDATHEPGATEERLFAEDGDVGVREAAGMVLIARRGERGAAQVVARLRAARDYDLEQGLVNDLGKFPDGIALARERTDDLATPMSLALLHAQVLSRRGERAAALRLIPRAVADGDIAAVHRAVLVARDLGANELREALQMRWRKEHERWRSSDPTMRRTLAQALVGWDEASGEEPRLHWALDLISDLGTDLNLRLQEALDRLAGSSSPATRLRAERLRRPAVGDQQPVRSE